MEDQFSYFAPYQCTQKGEYVVDGDTYVLYEGTRYNAPSVFGNNKTFHQFFGVRKSFRQEGHVDITAHFQEWEKRGGTLGNLERVMVIAEAGGGLDLIVGFSAVFRFTLLSCYLRQSR